MGKLSRTGLLLYAISLSVTIGVRAQYVTLDQDFEQENPDSIWEGDLDHFAIIEEDTGNRMLRLDNDEASGTGSFNSQIHTSSSIAYGEWEFIFKAEANLTTSNRPFIFLMADDENLKIFPSGNSSVNGYAIQAGKSGEVPFELVKISNGTQGHVITQSKTIIEENKEYRVRVNRAESGDWAIHVAEGRNSEPILDSEPGNDNEYTTSSYFGIYVRYTSRNSQNFYFDDILITATITDFFLEQTEVISANEIELTFSNDLDESFLSEFYFHINNDVGSPETVRLVGQRQVRLTFSQPFSAGEYTLTVDGIRDQFEQLLAPGTEAEFTVINPFRAVSTELLTGTILAVEFTEPPELTSWLRDDFEITNSEGTALHTQQLIEPDEPESPNRLLLVFNPPLPDGDYILTIHNNGTSINGWPISGPASLGFKVENPFYVTDVRTLNHSELEVTFSQPVQSAGSSDFSIDDYGAPDAIHIESDNQNKVLITYADPIDVGKHTLIINHVKSVHDWVIAPNTLIEFELYDSYKAGDLVISEFFYRTPVSWRTSEFDRPQYVEIYNRSDKLLNLRNYTVNGYNIRSESDLPIQPNGYLVIAKGVPVFENRFDNAQNLRNFVEAENFPRLNLTTSSPLYVATDEGVVADSLTYSPSEWGGNEVALERYDLDVPAAYRDNWAESEDALSGSPGLKNTIGAPAGPAEILYAAFPSPFVLHIVFSRTLSEESVESLTFYELNGGVIPRSVNRFEGDTRTVEFHLDRRLEDQTAYRFSYSGIEDIFGNAGTGYFNFTFENPFRILSAEMEGDRELVMKLTLPTTAESCDNGTFLLSDGIGSSSYTCDKDNSETIRLTFGSPLKTGRYQIVVNGLESFVTGLPDQWLLETDSSADFFQFDAYQPGDLILNEFMYRPPSGYPKYVEIKNVSDRFLTLKDFELRRSEGTQSNGGVISEFDAPIEPDGFAVITEDAVLLESVFGGGPWIEMSPFPGYTATLADQIRFMDPEGNLIESVHYHPSVWGGNGVSLERRDVNASSVSQENWAESLDPEFGTPGRPNSVYADDESPELISAGFIDERNVEVLFSGAIDTSVIAANSFSITGGRTIHRLEFTSNNRAVLTLDGIMNSGTTYTVTVRNISDIFGNILDRGQTGFIYYRIQVAEPGDILINEFMYRPPEEYTRYIELYNRSSKAVDLSGWKQANDTTTRRVLTTDRIILPPGEYMVLLPNVNMLSQFPDLPAINAGTSFAALKSGGDTIVITNAEDVIIDSLTYQPSWGGNGVALERRRADRSSLYAENWGDSPGEKYGTPGRANEVDRDFELLVSHIEVTGMQIVDVGFNTLIDAGIVSPDNFQIDGVRPQRIEFMDEAMVRLHFSQLLSTGHRELTIRSVKSSGGFEIAGNYTVSFTVFDIYEDGDILVNEFMYRPPETHPRYIELYNRSDKLLNLKGWRLQRRQVGGKRDRFIASENLSLGPEDYLVITDDVTTFNDIYPDRNVIELPSYPAFTVTAGDQIRVYTSDNILADSLAYIPSTWGGYGVALERLMLDLPSELRANWQESPNILLGTPGLPNDVSPDPTPPQIVNSSQFENLGFRLVFNKQLDEETVLNRENYQIDPGLRVSMVGLDKDGILLFADAPLVNGQLYTIKVEGIKDLFGNPMEPTQVEIRYVEFGTIQPGDLAINEILYRRLGPGEPEFVEIYNRTEINVDLSGWLLSDESGSAVVPGGTAIIANDYIVFTDEPSFADASENIVYLPGFQPLSNNGDAVVLKNLHGTVIDSVYYRPDWGDHIAGISLERKDPSALSIDPGNWTSSMDETGSTPAKINSRFAPDVYPPAIRFANLVHPDSIEVIFDSFIDLNANREIREPQRAMAEPQRAMGPYYSDTEQRVDTRFLLNGADAEILYYNPLQADRIVLSTAGVNKGEEIILTAENLTDFQGNGAPSLLQPVAQPIQSGDLIINEIMFNPITDSHDGIQDQSEYIEIYNRMPYAVSLEGIFLHDTPDENGSITRLDPVSSLTRWIPAHGYALFYPEPDAIEFEASRTAQFFYLTDDFAPLAMQVLRNTLSLPNSGREVYLADSTGVVIDKVHYNSSWHNPNIIDTRGISLERINPELGSDNPSNWGSHTSPLGGSPGSENTLYQPSSVNLSDVGITLSPNPFSPDEDGFEDNLMIHYKLDASGYLLNVRIYDRYGRQVRRLQEGIPAGLEGTLIWDGRTSDGVKNRIGIYIVVVEAYNSATSQNYTFRQPVVLARQF